MNKDFESTRLKLDRVIVGSNKTERRPLAPLHDKEIEANLGFERVKAHMPSVNPFKKTSPHKYLGEVLNMEKGTAKSKRTISLLPTALQINTSKYKPEAKLDFQNLSRQFTTIRPQANHTPNSSS